MYDLLLQQGRIIDGTGSAPYMADIAVKGGDIVAIGRLDGEAAKSLNVNGLVVAPGFIDLHTHSDLSFLLDPTAQSKVRQGVTLELAGNCGYSFAAPLQGAAAEMLHARMSQYVETFQPTWRDFGGYLDAVQRAGLTLNLAVQVGHGTVRAAVMGMEARACSGEELERMQALVADSLDAGAMGFSTGLFYAPGNYARLEEVIELASAAAARGKLYSTHMRDEGSHSVGLFMALNEAIEIGRRTGVRVQISHVKCSGPSVWGRANDVLDLFERTRREGIDIAGDQYPYTVASTSLTGALFPRWALEGGREATLKRLTDGAQRRRLHDDIAAMFTKWSTPAGVAIARYVPDPSLEGQNMVQIAETLSCDPAEAALRLYERGDASVVVHTMQDADVEAIASHAWIAVGSDGSSLSSSGPLSVGKPHPRSYGTNPRFLARFVRERQLVSLEEAVRKMTGLPAGRLGLTRRGRLAPGYAADLVVFDPDTVADTATFEAPHRYPVGIPHVVVNGALVIEHGTFTGATPGKVIRGFGE
ncbi:MAG TPA: D-aminoacylase [Alphaproteobacteria bacterium]|nr:D-aminoacylase [Alphaproteobacteria bacterium]